jgi:signal transduction histidine kinase
MQIALARHRHLLLLAILLALLLAVWERPESLTGRVLWVADVGLFLLWQPIVDAERRLRPLQVGLTLGIVVALATQMSWMSMAVWTAVLTALVGGKVVLARRERLRWFFLLAFSFLSFLLFAWISPQVVADAVGVKDVAPDSWVLWAAAALLVVLLALLPIAADDSPQQVYDFLVSGVILLVIGIILMRTHMLVAVAQVSHLEAVVQALLSFGILLLLLSWAWQPRLGFSGIGTLVSRYLLRLGFPFDQWLNRLTELSDKQSEPTQFFRHAAELFLDLPWVTGGRWAVEGRSGEFGHQEGNKVELRLVDAEIVLFASHRWSAALVWQANLLMRLVGEFLRAKQRDRLLQKIQYLQAVHETGSRLTHDVKNLLQSLDSLCFALQERGDLQSEELTALLKRQLPVVTQRLRTTLGKLSRPSDAAEADVDLAQWWGALQQRYRGQGVGFTTLSALDGAWRVPHQTFDNVADNLLGNALQKRSGGVPIKVSVELELAPSGLALRVSDDGEPFATAIVDELFVAPVASAGGLGIGLYHAADLARRCGYVLRLSSNRPGSVRLELAGKPLDSDTQARPSKP